MVIIEVKLENGKYVGYYRDKKVTEQHSAEKACVKLAKYTKGQK